MWLVAGSNVFGQWGCKNSIITKFQPKTPELPAKDKSLNEAKLLQISWSYNLFQFRDKFYVSGFYRDKGKQFAEIDLPIENISTDFTVRGNDYNLFIINCKKHYLWLVNINNGEILKKIDSAESLVEANSTKRLCVENDIVKIVCSNDSIGYLTSAGNIYNGVLPSYIDTSHCEGKVCDIECGYEHFLLLTQTGKVYSWGNGRRMQLGHDDIENLDTPMLIEALAGIKITKIKAGGWHSLAVSEFGDLYVWGWNETGQLGLKDKDSDLTLESQLLPTLVDFFDGNNEVVTANVKDIACGNRHSAVILENNTVWTTGSNKYGQLGLPTDGFQKMHCFRKIMDCSSNVELMCGPWTTVLVGN